MQRYQFARYHVTDAERLLPGQRPLGGPGGPRTRRASCSRRTGCSSSDPDTGGWSSTFSLTSVYVPYKKNNLAAFVSVDSDATLADYGQIQVLQLPNEQHAGPGPDRQRVAAPTPTSPRRCCRSSAGWRAARDLRQPAHAAGHRRADVRRSRLRRRASSPTPATRSCSTCWCPTATRSASASTLEGAIVDVLGGDTTTPPDRTAAPDNPPTDDSGNVPTQVRNLLDQAEEAFRRPPTALRQRRHRRVGHADRGGPRAGRRGRRPLATEQPTDRRHRRAHHAEPASPRRARPSRPRFGRPDAVE